MFAATVPVNHLVKYTNLVYVQMYLLVTFLLGLCFLRTHNNTMIMNRIKIARSPPVTPPAILAANSLEEESSLLAEEFSVTVGVTTEPLVVAK